MWLCLLVLWVVVVQARVGKMDMNFNLKSQLKNPDRLSSMFLLLC